MIKRNLCVINKTDDLSIIHIFKSFPLYCGCVDTDISEDIFCDMVWGVSKSSNLVQLLNLVEIDKLYSNHHNPGTMGKIWEDHHKNFANFIKNVNTFSVLEIGGATGNLVKQFIKSDNDFSWTVLEPSGVFNIKDSRVKFINDYLETHDFGNQKFNSVVHSHVIEHAYDPIKFLKKINFLLEDGGNQFISFPNIKRWIEKGYTNALSFEHTYYLDEDVIKNILNKSGFLVKTIQADDHSIFVHSIKVNEFLIEDIYSDSLTKYMSYIDSLRSKCLNMQKFVKNEKGYLFGAHVFAQSLINMGLDENSIISILDDDPLKQGLRLYGTKLMVESAEVLADKTNPRVIVDAGPYTQQIKDNLININSSIVFYE